jgi:hypothetical protein
MYSSTLSLTWTLDWVGISATPRPLYPRERDPVAIYRRLVGPQDRSGWVRKIWPPPRFDPRTVQPVANHYTDWAIPVHPGGGARNKSPRREAYKSPPSRAEVNDMWIHTSTPPHTLVACTGTLPFTVKNCVLFLPIIWHGGYLKCFRTECAGGSAHHDESATAALQVGLYRFLCPD